MQLIPGDAGTVVSGRRTHGTRESLQFGGVSIWACEFHEGVLHIRAVCFQLTGEMPILKQGTPTNHKRSKQRDEPIRTPRNCL